jgi:hypothetical protein
VQLNTVFSAVSFREEVLKSVARTVREITGALPLNLDVLDDRGRVRPHGDVEGRWAHDLMKLLDVINHDFVLAIDEVDLANDQATIEGDFQFAADNRAERRALLRVLRELRGASQLRQSRDESRLILLIAGVAASITTAATRFAQENQLFQFFTPHLLGPMTEDEVHTMVTTLGKRSGLKFDLPDVESALYAEYGGHPHLTRRACSLSAERRSSLTNPPVPYRVRSQDLVEVFSDEGERSPRRAAAQMLESFGIWYPEEYLAIRTTLDHPVDEIDRTLVSHAIDFGICDAGGHVRMNALIGAAHTA